MNTILQNNSSLSVKKTDKPKKRNGFKRFFHNLVHYNTGSVPRIWELDFFRGCLMVLVTLDHFFNFGLLFGFFDFRTVAGQWLTENFIRVYLNSAFRVGTQPFGLFIFSFLSGISCALTKNSTKRVVVMTVLCTVYMAVFATLHAILPQLVSFYFVFNIINVLTISVIFWWISDLLKLPDWVRLCFGLVIMTVGLTYFYSYFVRGTSDIENKLFALLVYNKHGTNLVQNFEPLLPHMGFFFIGGVLGKSLYKDKKTKTHSLVCRKIFLPLALFGKNSLVYYLILPELLLGILWLFEHFIWLFIG